MGQLVLPFSYHSLCRAGSPLLAWVRNVSSQFAFDLKSLNELKVVFHQLKISPLKENVFFS